MGKADGKDNPPVRILCQEAQEPGGEPLEPARPCAGRSCQTQGDLSTFGPVTEKSGFSTPTSHPFKLLPQSSLCAIVAILPARVKHSATIESKPPPRCLAEVRIHTFEWHDILSSAVFRRVLSLVLFASDRPRRIDKSPSSPLVYLFRPNRRTGSSVGRALD